MHPWHPQESEFQAPLCPPLLPRPGSYSMTSLRIQRQAVEVKGRSTQEPPQAGTSVPPLVSYVKRDSWSSVMIASDPPTPISPTPGSYFCFYYRLLFICLHHTLAGADSLFHLAIVTVHAEASSLQKWFGRQ